MVFVRTSIRQSRQVIDYVTAQWRLISIRKNIDAAFTNFDLVALPTMRITPRTINDSLNREEEPKPREPEVISNCTPFLTVYLPSSARLAKAVAASCMKRNCIESGSCRLFSESAAHEPDSGS